MWIIQDEKKVRSDAYFPEIVHKGSFPLIVKANSQARCENFHPITILEGTCCELAFAMSEKEALDPPLSRLPVLPHKSFQVLLEHSTLVLKPYSFHQRTSPDSNNARCPGHT